MRKCLAFCLYLLLLVSVAKADTLVKGDLRISGGGDLVFSDGSVQSTAQVGGPAGPVGPVGPAGPSGPQGPPGPETLAAICDAIRTANVPIPNFCPESPLVTEPGRWNGKKANFLGDSITTGYGIENGGAFPTLVGQTLGLAVVRNYGISGSSLAYATDMNRSPMSERYVDMDNDADLIFILGGANDWSANIPIGTINDVTNATFCGGLNVLLTGVLTKYPGKTIVLATPLHRYNDFLNLGMVNYVNAVIAAGSKFGIPVLDLYGTSGFYPQNDANKAAVMPDGTHPNEAGHIKLAHRVSGFLKTL